MTLRRSEEISDTNVVSVQSEPYLLKVPPRFGVYDLLAPDTRNA